MTILNEAKRFNVVACGRRFGKTTLGGNLLAETVISHSRSAAWFAPTFRLLEEAYQDHRRIFAPIIKRAVSMPAPRIELITGCAIDYWTLDDPATVARGRKYQRVIVDEAAMARYLETAWTEALRPTLTDYRGDAFFLSTPKGRNYFSTLFDRAKTEDDWMSWQMPTVSNPFIDPSEVESAKQSLPSIAFRQEYLAEFVDLAGARVKREWLQTGLPSEPLDVYLGVDLAISTRQDADFSAIVAVSRDSRGNLYVLDVARVRADFAAVLRFVEEMARKWNPKTIAIENVQYQAAVIQELLRRTKLPIRGIRPDKDKLTRFMPIEARYEYGQVFHSPSLPDFWEEELLSFPVGHHDDCVDALAYAWTVCGQPKVFMAV